MRAKLSLSWASAKVVEVEMDRKKQPDSDIVSRSNWQDSIIIIVLVAMGA